MKTKPVYYSQKDPRWKNVMFSSTGDKSQTMSTSGCGPTSLAMAITQFADSSVTPVTMAARIVKGGWRTPNHGTEWGCFAPICKEYGLTCVQTYSHESAQKCAAGGGMVICSMGPGLWTRAGHYILLWKVDGSTVYINDPNSTASAKSKAALATLQAQRKVYFCVAAPKKNDKEETTMAGKSKPSAWAEEAAEWAVENGLIRGDANGDCKWQDNLTREQFAVMLKRYHEKFNS